MLKTVSSLGNIVGALVYRGTWDASSNTPTLTSSVGSKGDYYYVSVAGSTNLNGITDWQIGDLALFNGTVWQKIDNTDSVLSVNGQTGVVVLDANSVGATANTTYVLSSGLLTGGGRLNGNVTLGLTSVPVANVPGAVPNTVNVLASGLLTGGGPLTSNVTIGLTTVPIANVPSAVPNTVNIIASGLLTGGGNLSSNVTIGLTTVPIANVPSAVPNTVNVLAGGLLSGGGNLSANVTISLANVPNANVTGLGNMAFQNSTSVTITGGNVNVQTTNMTSTTSSSATFATSSLLLVPAGFFSFDLNGTVVKVPYYAV
jgi:hypothetical protein